MTSEERNLTPIEAKFWDQQAALKGPLRAAWDDDLFQDKECVAEILPYMPDKGILLDLGCGPGRLTTPMADALPRAFIVGLDISLGMLAGAPDRKNVHYRIGDGESLIDGDIAGAWSMLTFQHLTEKNVKLYLREFGRWLKPGAVFRFQYADGGGDHFMHLAARYRVWCAEAGLKVEEVHYNRVKDGWAWVTARR